MAMGMYIKRIHRQHSSCVVTLPKNVMRRLQAKSGDYIRFEDGNKYWQVIISKVETGGSKDGGNKGNSDKRDQGGRT